MYGLDGFLRNVHVRCIQLGNRTCRIQHAQIMLKTAVPNFYPKMHLKVYRNPSSLVCRLGIILKFGLIQKDYPVYKVGDCVTEKTSASVKCVGLLCKVSEYF